MSSSGVAARLERRSGELRVVFLGYVKGSQFSSFLKPSSCDGGAWRRKSGSRCRSEVQLSRSAFFWSFVSVSRSLGLWRSYAKKRNVVAWFVIYGSSGSAFNPPPPPLLFFIFPASVASALAEDTGSLYRRFALVSFKFLFQFRLPPVLASGRCRLPPFGSRRRLRVERLVFSLGMSVSSLILVAAAVSGPTFCKNCLSANGFGGDLRVSMELELKRVSWDG
ncbi:hypothetical protein F2Q68_00019983 [Brassica cretica]|uniref:Uncharacterized protein n=1 Tax=Brassica cretica TaxID=69181 RepID=A0A8S9FY95_BRACR|nr:hypothetical protein F2Q68_00019983 [Brassica cretica]